MGVEFSIIVYTRSNGKKPAIEALELFAKTSPRLQAAVISGIKKLEHSSTHSGTLIKKAAPNLWYLRIKEGSNYARLFFTYNGRAEIYLLNGFVKKANRIPSKELRQASDLIKEIHNVK